MLGLAARKQKAVKRHPLTGLKQAPRLVDLRHKRGVDIDPIHYDIMADAAKVEGTTVNRVLDAILADWFGKHTRYYKDTDDKEGNAVPTGLNRRYRIRRVK